MTVQARLTRSLFTVLGQLAQGFLFSHARMYIFSCVPIDLLLMLQREQLFTLDPLTAPHVRPESPLKVIISSCRFALVSRCCLTVDCLRPSTWCNWNNMVEFDIKTKYKQVSRMLCLNKKHGHRRNILCIYISIFTHTEKVLYYAIIIEVHPRFKFQ